MRFYHLDAGGYRQVACRIENRSPRATVQINVSCMCARGVQAVRMYFQEPQFGVLPACTPLVHIARCDFIDLGQWLWSDFQEPQFGMLSYLPVPHCIPRRKRFHWYQTVALAGLPRATIQHATCLYLATVSDHETVSAWVGIQAGKPSMPN